MRGRILSYDCGTVQMVRSMRIQSHLTAGTIIMVLPWQAVEITTQNMILVRKFPHQENLILLLP